MEDKELDTLIKVSEKIINLFTEYKISPKDAKVVLEAVEALITK